MAGGKRRPSNKSKPRRPNPSSARSSLFVEGGILAGFSTPPPSSRGTRARSSGRANVTNSNNEMKNWGANVFGYVYPSSDLQRYMPSESDLEGKNADNSSKVSKPFILLDSKESKIVAYKDQSLPSENFKVDFSYDYSSGFVLGESSHHGLGFSSEAEAAPDVTEQSEGEMKEDSSHRRLGFSVKPELKLGEMVSSPRNVDDELEEYFGSSSHEEDTDAGKEEENLMGEVDSEMVQAFLDETSSPTKNSGFLSMGGMRLYTKDISEGESDEGDRESSEEGSSLELLDSEDSEDTSESGSDIDDGVVEDYMEGICGGGEIFDDKWLAKLNVDAPKSVDDDDSSNNDDEVVKKMSGIALLEASREYGLKNPQPRKKKSHAPPSKPVASNIMWSSALDDLMLVKDRRRLFKKKNQVAQYPVSWPSGSRKNKSFRNYPGEKKKHRKEMIAVKRRERMLRRGVDLEQINLKLKNMVLQKVDIMSFHPMHSRDCSQVQKLAAIYRLRSGCQGSGKKGLVIVTRTQHTSLPSASDQIRLEKLIGAYKDDADFPVTETPKLAGSARSRPSKNSAGGSFSNEKKSSGKKSSVSFASQPVSFVSSGVIQSDSIKADAVVDSSFTAISANESDNALENPSSTNFAAFELHTKGFGSKMMAKMGYVEGSGLGKEGQGMAAPIEVIQRPKSLGLGVKFSESSDNGPTPPPPGAGRRVDPTPPRAGRSDGTRIGAFEQHTKGFGSKMMARMGFREGTGLGRDSQGIVNPIAAVRRPNARGLGAEKQY